eukprot:3051628-Rhodomonas_salina.1
MDLAASLKLQCFLTEETVATCSVAWPTGGAASLLTPHSLPVPPSPSRPITDSRAPLLCLHFASSEARSVNLKPIRT